MREAGAPESAGTGIGRKQRGAAGGGHAGSGTQTIVTVRAETFRGRMSAGTRPPAGACNKRHLQGNLQGHLQGNCSDTSTDLAVASGASIRRAVSTRMARFGDQHLPQSHTPSPEHVPSPDRPHQQPLNTIARPYALSVRGLSLSRNERQLFQRLDLDLPPGGALALTGRNGAGKTSLLRVLGGLLRPDSGEIRLSPVPTADTHAAGEDRDGDLEQAARAERSILVGARDPLKATLSVAELISGWQALLGGQSDPRHDGGHGMDDALAAFGLRSLAAMPCGYLSSGQRKRVSLARLLLAPTLTRPLWLLDEPTNALDVQAQALLAAAVARHRSRGGMVIVATHLHLDWPDLRELRLGSAQTVQPQTGAQTS